MQTIQPNRVSQSILQGLQDAITYFRNHHHQMLYVETISSNLPIGSGKSACKVIIKTRLECSSMKWKDWGASVVLSLRTLTYTKGCWQQFWSKINRYGFSL